MERWWCKKYVRPAKDPLLQEYTYEELQLEYFEDYIDEHGVENLVLNTGTEETPVAVTNDPVFNKWEAQLARGEMVDPTEGMDAESKAAFSAFLKQGADKAADVEAQYDEGVEA